MDRLPYVSSFNDRHGRLRWRYRRSGVTVMLPGQPGDEAFQRAYMAALDGRRPAAAVLRHPNHSLPQTMRAAWRHYAQSAEFRRLRETSRQQYIARAERLLAMPVSPYDLLTWADVPMPDLRRRHIKALLSGFGDRQHAAYDALVIVKKCVQTALDLEWIEIDPTHLVRARPQSDGHRAWSDQERAAYESHHALGTRPRTVYALALYTGQRRGDLVRLRWADLAGDRLVLSQEKTGKRLSLPILPALRDALEAVPDRSGATVIGIGADTVTNQFLRWTDAAEIERGATLHGLRKTLGKLLAEAGATTRELMDVLGHDAMSHAELYSRAADQARMADAGMEKARGRLLVAVGNPSGKPSGKPGLKSLK